MSRFAVLPLTVHALFVQCSTAWALQLPTTLSSKSTRRMGPWGRNSVADGAASRSRKGYSPGAACGTVLDLLLAHGFLDRLLVLAGRQSSGERIAILCGKGLQSTGNRAAVVAASVGTVFFNEAKPEAEVRVRIKDIGDGSLDRGSVLHGDCGVIKEQPLDQLCMVLSFHDDICKRNRQRRAPTFPIKFNTLPF